MIFSVQKLRPHAQIPKRATAQSAGYDLYALPEKPLTIQPQEICKVPTGIAVAPSRPDVALCIFPRSGLSTKHGITLINSVGLVDSDYRGELLIPLINHGSGTLYRRSRHAGRTAGRASDPDTGTEGSHSPGHHRTGCRRLRCQRTVIISERRTSEAL